MRDCVGGSVASRRDVSAVADNAAERLSQEIKRRTRVVRVFPNPEALLRLVSAILAEISDEWDAAKSYLNMNPPSQQHAA